MTRDSLTLASELVEALDQRVGDSQVGSALTRALWFDSWPQVAVEYAALSRLVDLPAVADMLVCDAAQNGIRHTLARSLVKLVPTDLIDQLVTEQWEHLRGTCRSPIDDVDLGQMASLCVELGLPRALKFLEEWARASSEPSHLEAIEFIRESYPEAWATTAADLSRGTEKPFSEGLQLGGEERAALVTAGVEAIQSMRATVNMWTYDSARGLRAEVEDAFDTAGPLPALQASLMIPAPWTVVNPLTLSPLFQDHDAPGFAYVEKLVAGAPPDFRREVAGG